MKRLMLVAAAAALGALAGASSARADLPILVCGLDRCVVSQNATVEKIPFYWGTYLPTAPAVGPQPFYLIYYGGDPHTPVRAFYVPGAALLRVPGGSHTLASWIRLTRAQAAGFKEATAGLPPYPAPTALRTVIVNHSRATDPTSYLHLYAIGTPAPKGTAASDLMNVSLIGDASPWTDGLTSIAVSRHANLLKREGRLFTIPAAIAARIRAGRSLRG